VVESIRPMTLACSQDRHRHYDDGNVDSQRTMMTASATAVILGLLIDIAPCSIADHEHEHEHERERCSSERRRSCCECC
jgi:hypothetical protein